MDSYGQKLPVDLLGLVASYLLCDPNESESELSAIFAAPMFGCLTQTRTWTYAINERARFFYRTYWSTNNYTAALFLDCNSEINYVRLLRHTDGFADRISSDEEYPPSIMTEWVGAQREGYDLVLMRLRDRVAAELNHFRQEEHSTDDMTNELEHYLQLPDLLAVFHSTLAQEVLIFCNLIPSHVQFVLLTSHPCAIHYSLWEKLYVTYVQPTVGAKLGYQGSSEPSNDTINAWRAMWLHSVVCEDDVSLFEDACAKLGFIRADISAMIKGSKTGCLGVNIETLCVRGAVNLITNLNLWESITPYRAININVSSRLRVALSDQNYIFPLACVGRYNFRGLPAHIAPFLPAEITLQDIVGFDQITPVVVLAVLLRSQVPVSWSERYHLFVNQNKLRSNLIPYLLPINQLTQEMIRAQFGYLDQDWDRLTQSDATNEIALTPHSPKQVSYVDLYRLLLAYVAQHWSIDFDAQPRVPFCCYTMYDFMNDPEVMSVIQASEEELNAAGDEAVFSARFYTRLLILNHAGPAVVTHDVPALRSRSTIFVYLPAHTPVHITGLNEEIWYTLYDYDIGDFDWWCKAFTARYGSAAKYEESDVPSRYSDTEDSDNNEGDEEADNTIVNPSDDERDNDDGDDDNDDDNNDDENEGEDDNQNEREEGTNGSDEDDNDDESRQMDVTQSRKRRA